MKSLTSILIYQDPVRNIQLIANELKVNYILEGSFKRIGNEMRVTAQLIEPKSDKHIWLKNYDLPYKEVIGIPAEVALQIAEHLKTFIADSEHRRIERIPTDNLEAYETLKQAGYLISSRDNYNVPQAVELALEAISLDPEYADAYAFAGVFTLWQGVYSGSIEIQYAAINAIPYIDKALELDQNNASAHICKAMISEWARWDYIEAEKEYLEAIELEPNNPVLYEIADEFFIKMHQLDAFWMIMDKSPEKNASPGEKIMSHILSGNIREAYNAITTISAEEQEYRWIGEHYLWLGGI